MTEKELEEKIVAKMSRLKVARQERDKLIAQIRDVGEQMQKIGEFLVGSPQSIEVSDDENVLIVPIPPCPRRLSLKEVEQLPDDLAGLSLLNEEIGFILSFLKGAGFNDIIRTE